MHIIPKSLLHGCAVVERIASTPIHEVRCVARVLAHERGVEAHMCGSLLFAIHAGLRTCLLRDVM